MTLADTRAKTIEVLRRHHKDPLLFVKEALKAEPTPQQAQLLQAAAIPGAHVAVRSGHGTGKSTSLAWLLLWFLCTHPDARVPATAPTGHQLDDVLWPEVLKWHSKLHPYYKAHLDVSTEKVMVKGSPSFAVKRTSRKENPEALQGFHATNLLFLLDEASGIPEQIFEVAEGALSTHGARVVMCANPTQTTGYFHRAFHRDRDRWTCLRFSSEDSSLVSPEYVQNMRDTYGEDSDIYRIRVLGDFPRASMAQLISPDLAYAAAKLAHLESDHAHMPRILGADVSYFGDDRSVLFERQGLISRILWQGRNIDTHAYASLIARFWRERSAHACFVDVTGWGAGVVDTLRSLGFSPQAVYFGGNPGDTARFVNKRSEMWWLMKEWLEGGGMVPPGTDLHDDLTGPEYYYSPAGKIGLERKEDLKKRGFASPDLADALAMTFAEPVAIPSVQVLPGEKRVKTKYDPLKRRG